MGITKRYIYEGPVMLFDRCIQHRWIGITYAVSEKKARSNLAYQYKRDYLQQRPTAKVTLPGLLMVDE